MDRDQSGATALAASCCAPTQDEAWAVPLDICIRAARARKISAAARAGTMVMEFAPPMLAPVGLTLMTDADGGMVSALAAATLYGLTAGLARRIRPTPRTGDYPPYLELLTGLIAALAVGGALLMQTDVAGYEERLLVLSVSCAVALVWPWAHRRFSQEQLTPLERLLSQCGQHCRFCSAFSAWPAHQKGSCT